MSRKPKTHVASSAEQAVLLLERLRELHPDKRPDGAPSFEKYAWQKFDPEYVTTILLSGADHFFGQREILFNGLSIWCLAPDDQPLIRRGMRLTAMRLLDKAEKSASQQAGFAGPLPSIVARAVTVGEVFFEEVYYPMGGIGGLIGSSSERGIRAGLREHGRHREHAIQMLDVITYRVLSQNKLTTINKSSASVAQMSELSPERVKAIWYQFFDRIFVLKAASSIVPAGGRETLLDLIIDNKIHIGKHGHLLPELLARAKGLEDLFSSAIKAERSSNSSRITQRAPAPIKPELPPLTLDQIDIVTSKHRRKNAARASEPVR